MGAAKKKTVFVLVHGDIWGALNANHLLPALAKQGCDIRLIVSRSTPAADGLPANKLIPELRPFLALKENGLLSFFDVIDTAWRLEKREAAPVAKYQTFRGLAAQYCGGEIYFTTHGGKKGGEQIQAIFDQIGITPDLVLSGDTLAVLPATIVDRYPCFGTHPGPLPDIQGMHGTERSLMFSRVYTGEGAPYQGPGLPYVKGSLFQLAAELDRGPVVKFAMAPCITGMTLMQLRSELYYALIECMIEHLPIFLDPERRGELLEKRKAYPIDKPVRGLPPLLPPVKDLDSNLLSKWTSDGFIASNEDGSAFLQMNEIYNAGQFQNWVGLWWPDQWPEREFEGIFCDVFAKFMPVKFRAHQEIITVKPPRVIEPGSVQFRATMKRLIENQRV